MVLYIYIFKKLLEAKDYKKGLKNSEKLLE